jgi:cell wall-associated NlpC family hydrolase
MFLPLLFVLNSCFNVTVSESIVSTEQAQVALTEAMTCLNRPYQWGENGPEAFDCSGLIMWSYQQTVQKSLYYQNSLGLRNDVRMDDLYSYNVTHVSSADVRPGDIVFVTKKDGSVSHGGLFIEWIDADSFLYVNASSSHGEVVIDSWTMGRLNRGYWFMGFGQLVERTISL